MQSDRDWVTSTYSEIDTDRGPVALWQVRARHPGQRWRQVARVRRLASVDATFESICEAVGNIGEPIVEVLAFTARGRQPESTKSPWTTHANASDAGSLALGEVDELDVEGDVHTVAMRFARATMRAAELERVAVITMLAKQAEQARADADYWRQACMESMRAQGGAIPPSLEVVERDERPALAGEVMLGLQSLSTTVIGSMMGGADGPVREAARAWFAALSREQLSAIAAVLRPTQAHALLALAAMVEGREPPAAAVDDELEVEVA